MSDEIAEIATGLIRAVPDFPEKGIVYRDITPLLADGEAFSCSARAMTEDYQNKDIDFVAGVESRGFIFSSLAAFHLNAGVLAVRKAGKLPGKVRGVDYELEYGKGRLEISEGLIFKGARVLVMDDVLATGGTAAAAGRLLQDMGAVVVGYSFLIELDSLQGRKHITEHGPEAENSIMSLLNYK